MSRSVRETSAGNWVGHILRMHEHRLVWRVLLICVKPIPESIFGDVPELDVAAAIKVSRERIEWKSRRHVGETAENNSTKQCNNMKSGSVLPRAHSYDAAVSVGANYNGLPCAPNVTS